MKKNSGQITLIALLVMVVLLTIGLAVVSRSVTDIRISKETEESARAFSAAEAGIEEALSQNLSAWVGQHTIPALNVTYSVGETTSFQTKIARNDVAEVQLDGFTGNGVNVDWRDSGLELSLIYESGGYKIARWVRYNGPSCGENFTEVQDADMPFEIVFADFFIVNPKALRIRPICAETTVTVSGVGVDLPVQSYTIRSSATIPEGRQTRTVELTKSSLAILPPIFDYVLFSGGGLNK